MSNFFNTISLFEDCNLHIWREKLLPGLIGMLLVSRSRLVEKDAVEVFHYYGFYLSSSFLMYYFKSRLENIMFCTDGKISIRINLPLFSTVVPSSIFMFLSCRPFVVITTLSTGLVGVEITSVSWLGQLTVGV